MSVIFVILLSILNVSHGQSLLRYDGSLCPNMCGEKSEPMHGRCNVSIVSTCECVDQFNGRAPDCSDRVCPKGIAWFDQPLDATTAHTTLMECSNRGRCNTRTGTCRCELGYEGDACQRTSCPGMTASGDACSSHGRCVSMREAAEYENPVSLVYTEWEADHVFGCVCDEGYTGADCSQRQCPLSPDPLFRGSSEAHTIFPTNLEPSRTEIQLLTMSGTATSGGSGSGGSADVNELQRIIFYTTHQPPTGSFVLRMDCRPDDPNNLLNYGPRPGVVSGANCDLLPDSARVLSTGVPVIVSSNCVVVTNSVLNALGSMVMFEAADFTVNCQLIPTVISAMQTDYTMQLDIEFSGLNVGGNFPQFVLDATGVSGAFAPIASGETDGTLTSASITTVRHGTQLRGAVDVFYDDQASNPSHSVLTSDGCDDEEDPELAPRGMRSVRIYPSDTGHQLTLKFTALLFGCHYDENAFYSNPLQSPQRNPLSLCAETPPSGAVVVEKVGTGGPGLSLRVTAVRGIRVRGDLAQMTLTPAPGALVPLHVWDASAVLTGIDQPLLISSEERKGTFLSGEYWVALPYWAPDGTVVLSPPVGPIKFCASGAHVSSLISAMLAYPLGSVIVESERQEPPDPDLWMGNYAHRFIFASEPTGLYGIAPEVISNALFTSAVVPVDTARVQSGVADGSAPISEVQLINCRCGDGPLGCNENVPFGQTASFRLTFARVASAPIPFDASASQLQAALAALPGVRNVRVRLYDYNSPGISDSQLCDSDGTTAAITFAWNAGPVGPLTIDVGHNELSGHLSIGIAPDVGIWGGGRARAGSHIMKECGGRGVCDRSRGRCECFDGLFGPGDGGNWPDAVATNAASNLEGLPYSLAPSKILHSCGTVTANAGPNREFLRCPGPLNEPCNLQGTCSGPPEFLCSCKSGFSGSACEIRNSSCFESPRLFDVPIRRRLMPSTDLLAPGVPAPTPTPALGALPSPAERMRRWIGAHAHAVCGDHGTCSAGVCQCSGGWSGPGCGLAPCPGLRGVQLTSGHPFASYTSSACFHDSPCVDLKTFSRYMKKDPIDGSIVPDSGLVYSGWDASMLRGCACDLKKAHFLPLALNYGYPTGYACEERSCPFGPDPQDPASFKTTPYELQAVRCSLSAGSVRFSFRGFVSPFWSPFDAPIRDAEQTPAEFLASKWTIEQSLRATNATNPLQVEVISEAHLQALINGEDLKWQPDVARTEFPEPSFRRLCDSNTNKGTVTLLRFLSLSGRLPLIEFEYDAVAQARVDLGVGEKVEVISVRPGGVGGYECNRRGVCDRSTGICNCQPQFGSSNGKGGPGELGDCGFRNPLIKFNASTGPISIV